MNCYVHIDGHYKMALLRTNLKKCKIAGTTMYEICIVAVLAYKRDVEVTAIQTVYSGCLWDLLASLSLVGCV